MTYCAHPYYKNETHWFDWVLIAWDVPKSNKVSFNNDIDTPDYVELPKSQNNSMKISNKAMLIPGKSICIIEDENNDKFAIVHSCLQHQNKMSVMTNCWQKW